MKPSYRFYRGCYRFARVAFGIFIRLDVQGRENIPDGAALICANHSSIIDPVFLAFAFGIGCFTHFIAKVELFRIPVLSSLIKKLGAISVDRDGLDVGTIRSTLSYLKQGEKVAIFPEGTRSSKDDEVAAKRGAVKIAEHSGVPVVPVFIPRKKRMFRKLNLVIGEPYCITKEKESKRTQEEYSALADMLMEKIKSLNPVA